MWLSEAQNTNERNMTWFWTAFTQRKLGKFCTLKLYASFSVLYGLNLKYDTWKLWFTTAFSCKYQTNKMTYLCNLYCVLFAYLKQKIILCLHLVVIIFVIIKTDNENYSFDCSKISQKRSITRVRLSNRIKRNNNKSSQQIPIMTLNDE